jgi:hypothetical protein
MVVLPVDGGPLTWTIRWWAIIAANFETVSMRGEMAG